VVPVEYFKVMLGELTVSTKLLAVTLITIPSSDGVPGGVM